MLKNLTQIYCLLMCLVSAITLMITLGITLNSVVETTFTEYKFASELNKFSSNDKYIDDKTRYNQNNAEKWTSLSEEEVKTKRIIEREDYIERRKREAISTIISSITWFFVAGLFFIIHWRLQKKYSLSN